MKGGVGREREGRKEGRAVNAAAPVGFYCHLPSQASGGGGDGRVSQSVSQSSLFSLYVTGFAAT